MGTLTQLADGEVQGCVGCHESRSSAPPGGATGLSQRLAATPDTITPPPWGEGPVDYVQLVQPVLDRYCTSCHSGPTPKGHVDLSGDRTRLFSMSYETLAGADAGSSDTISTRGRREISRRWRRVRGRAGSRRCWRRTITAPRSTPRGDGGSTPGSTPTCHITARGTCRARIQRAAATPGRCLPKQARPSSPRGPTG